MAIKPKLFNIIFCVLLLYRFTALPLCFAETIHPNAGTTGANFLKLIPSARALALGGAFTGLSDDVDALYFNPAGILQIKGKEVSISHSELYQGLRHNFAGYIFPVGEDIFGISVTGFYTQNDLERRTWEIENNPYEPITEPEGYFNAYSISVQASFAREILEKVSGGISTKIIRETIDEISAYSFAVDLGLLYPYKKNLIFGLSIKNIGTPIKFIRKEFILPLEINIGASYLFNKKVKIVADIGQPIDDFLIIRSGVEYSPFEVLYLRTGYNYRFYNDDLLSGLCVGFGTKFRSLYFNYAFLPYNVLGASHHFSFSLKFY